MLCYLTCIEPYYIKCINEGPFVPKTAQGLRKPVAQWTPDERRVVNQELLRVYLNLKLSGHQKLLRIYLNLKTIIISYLPDDTMESVINCDTMED